MSIAKKPEERQRTNMRIVLSALIGVAICAGSFGREFWCRYHMTLYVQLNATNLRLRSKEFSALEKSKLSEF